MSTGRKAKWRERAGRLALLLPKARLHPAVVAWAERAGAGETWWVAFSGGADSLALLLLLWAHWPARRRKLRVLHFNHRLRGRASAGDVRFCRAVCRGLGVRLHEGCWLGAPKQASEAMAREARQTFFTAQMAREQGRALWLGQQLDDVAETFFMRLARGSGTGGLCAPRPVQVMPQGRRHLRPLLPIGRREIQKLLEAAGANWRTDATNAGGIYLRNRIRHEVVPRWRRAVSDREALAGAALARELLEEDDVALSAWVDEIGPVRADGALNLVRLRSKPRAILRRALHRWLGPTRLSRQAFEALLTDIECGRQTRHSLGSGRWARIGERGVVLVRENGK